MKRHLAIGWARILTNTAFVSFNAVAVKQMYDSTQFPVLQVTWLRYLVVWTLTTFIYFAHIPDRHLCGSNSQEFWFLITRSILFFGGLNLYLLSLMFLPIGIATTLVFTAPFFTTIGSWMYYRIKPSHTDIGLIILAFCAMILMFAPWLTNRERFGSQWRNGVFLALASALSTGVEELVRRSLRSKIHWIQIEYLTSLILVWGIIPACWLCQLVYLNLNGRLGVYYIFQPYAPIGSWFVCIGIGFASVFCTSALEKASMVLGRRQLHIAAYLQVPLLYLVDWLWFEKTKNPGQFELIGSAMLFAVLITKGMLEEPEPAESRDELRPLLARGITSSTQTQMTWPLARTTTFLVPDQPEAPPNWLDESLRENCRPKREKPGGGWHSSTPTPSVQVEDEVWRVWSNEGWREGETPYGAVGEQRPSRSYGAVEQRTAAPATPPSLDFRGPPQEGEWQSPEDEVLSDGPGEGSPLLRRAR